MRRRTYAGERDLKRLQDFNAAAIAVTDHYGYLHPGDIPHQLYNGNRHYDPAEVMTIWEDEQGVAAWLLVQPRHKAFGDQVRPDLRGSEFEREVLAYAAERTVELMHSYEIAGDSIYTEAFQTDSTRCDLLLALGWEADSPSSFALTRVEIPHIDLPALPDGYSFQTAKGVEDAGALGAVHSASFGGSWTPESYRKVMESPGYAPERELLIQAPDGTYVAFTVTWHDHLNRTGLFEPVGTHKDYRRQGFGRALLLFGLQQMAAAGMQYATVAHATDNEAATGLYHACGFRPWYLFDGFSKRIAP